MMRSTDVMKRYGLSALAGFTSALVLSVSPASAAVPEVACDSASPSFLELGDDYYTPTPDLNRRYEHDLPAEKLATRLLSPLSRKALRRGDGHRVVCFGTGDTARAVTYRFDLDQLEHRSFATGFSQLEAFEDRHTIESDVRDKRVNDTLSSENIELPPLYAWSIGPDGNSLVNNRRLRRDGSETVANGSVLVEIDLLARPTRNRGLEISQTIYVNGYRSDFVTWRLTR